MHEKPALLNLRAHACPLQKYIYRKYYQNKMQYNLQTVTANNKKNWKVKMTNPLDLPKDTICSKAV